MLGPDAVAALPDPIRRRLADEAPFVDLVLHPVEALDCFALFGLE